MARSTFVHVDLDIHRELLVSINVEYMSWISSELHKSSALTAADLNSMPVSDYVEQGIDKLCGQISPWGAFYLVEYDGKIAGMGGLRWISEGLAEIKRMYVRPAHRGKGLGKAIIERLLEDAMRFGYRIVVLDSAPFMQVAQQLYQEVGFAYRPPYAQTEVPPELHLVWRFMEQGF